MGAQIQIWGKNVRTSFTLGKSCAPKLHFGAVFVRTFVHCCAFFGHLFFRQIAAFHFWETVGRAAFPTEPFIILESTNMQIVLT